MSTDASDLNDLAGFQWIRTWIAVMQDGDALMEPGSEKNYQTTRYTTSIYSPIDQGSKEPGLDLVLMAGAENNGFFPGIMLGGQRLETNEFDFSLVDDNVTLSLRLAGSCSADADADADLYQDANLTFNPSGVGFSGTIASTCKRHNVFLRCTGGVA